MYKYDGTVVIWQTFLYFATLSFGDMFNILVAYHMGLINFVYKLTN